MAAPRALSPHEYRVLWRLAHESGEVSTSYDIAWSLPSASPMHGNGRRVGTIFRSLRHMGLVDTEGDGFWRLTDKGRAIVFPGADG